VKCFELKDIIVEVIVKKSYGMVAEYKCNTQTVIV